MATPSSYYCSKCQTEYEVDKPCPDCGQAVFPRYAQTHGHQKPPVVEHGTVGTQTTGSNDARAWRVERYLELKFTIPSAELLADAIEVEVDSTGREWPRPLNWQKVAAQLDRGATHAQALGIYS